MDIGFALIPDKPFSDELVKIENEVHEQCGFHHKLGTSFNIPHLTIFQGSFQNNVDCFQMLRYMTEYFISCDHLQFNEVAYQAGGWYFYACQKTDELVNLHDWALKECRDYLDLQDDRLKQDMAGFTSEQIAGIKEYGYRYAGKAFMPHVTLGRSNDISANSELISLLKQKLSKLPKDVPVYRMTCYKMGQDGQYAETLASITTKW